MNKKELIRRIRERRAEIADLCARHSEDEIGRLPGPKSDWTVKDLIAHLTYWEHATLDRRSGVNTDSTWGDVNATNAQLLEKSRKRSAAQILREFAESKVRVLEKINALSEQDLESESPWNDGLPLWKHLADDTCDHYEEHLPALQSWANRAKK